MAKLERILIGRVGVDSGQLMICDPCYIDSEWKNEKFRDVRIYEHKTTKRQLQYMKDFTHYEVIITEYGKTMNQLNETGEWKEIPPPPAEHNLSYNACCRASHEGSGQLNYLAGHSGVAVIFSSGYGDGHYPVYGYKNKDGRIVKVEIIMD